MAMGGSDGPAAAGGSSLWRLVEKKSPVIKITKDIRKRFLCRIKTSFLLQFAIGNTVDNKSGLVGIQVWAITFHRGVFGISIMPVEWG